MTADWKVGKTRKGVRPSRKVRRGVGEREAEEEWEGWHTLRRVVAVVHLLHHHLSHHLLAQTASVPQRRTPTWEGARY